MEHDAALARRRARAEAIRAEAAAAVEDAAVARAALDVAGVASRVLAAATAKRQEEDQATIEALRVTLGSVEAKLEASTEALAACATRESEHLALVAPLTIAAHELAASLGVPVAAPGGGGDLDLGTQLRGLASLGKEARFGVPGHTLDCARASAELAFSCLSVVGCDHAALLRAEGFVVPDRAQLSSARESVRDLSRPFLSRVWGEHGPAHLRALRRLRQGQEAPVGASGSTSAPGVTRPSS